MHVAKILTTSITGIALAFSMLASTIPANAAVGYHAAYFSESDFLARSPGQTGQFAVGYTNTGDRAWVKGAAGQQANLATAAPLDNTNDFTAGWSLGWLSANRYTSQDAALVAPGQIGFFIYNFTVPAAAAAGEHRFYGREVIDGVTFMEDYGYYQSVTVGAATAGPALTTLTPATGTVAGGTSVTITGTGFVCNPTLPTVNFGTTAGTVTSCGATSITVTSPAGAIGTVQVTVTNTGGAASNGLTYTYADTTKPTYTAVSVAAGASGTVTVTFSEPVCRAIGTAMTAGEWLITVNGGGPLSPLSDNAPICDSNTAATNGVTSFQLFGGPATILGDFVTVTLNCDATAADGDAFDPDYIDASGNTANCPRTNTTTVVPSETVAPFMTAASATATTTLKLTYSEAVYCAAVSAGQLAQFSVTTSAGTQSPTGITCATLPGGSTTVTLTFATTIAAGGTVTYTQSATSAERVKDINGNGATSPQALTFAAFVPDTTPPTLTDTRVVANVLTTDLNDIGDSFTITFSEAMNTTTAGDVITISDADGSTADITCGFDATCTFNTAGTVLTVTLTAAPLPTNGGTTPLIQLPATITALSGFMDVAGNVPNLAGSADRVIDVE